MSDTDDEVNSDHMSVSDQEDEIGRGQDHSANATRAVEVVQMHDSSLSTPISSDVGEVNQISTEKNPTVVMEELRHPTMELDDAAVR